MPAPDPVPTRPAPHGTTSGAPACRITVVVVHHRQPARCAATVEALAAQTVPCDIVVVDNGPVGAPPPVRRAGVTVLSAGTNRGFGGGANVGLRWWWRHRDTPYVAVCPHDARPEPGCLEAIVAEMDRRPEAGLACADVGDGKIPVVDDYFGGMSVGRLPPAGWVPAGYPHGTLLVARRACLADIGVFDERYFAYCEEADLGLRARAAGWEVGVVAGARVTNTHLSSTLTANEYLQLRNSLLLVRTHFGRYKAGVRFAIAVADTLWRELRPASRSPFYDRRGRLAALTDHLRGRVGPPPPHLG